MLVEQDGTSLEEGALEEVMLETRPWSRGSARLIVRVELRLFQLSYLLINTICMLSHFSHV